MIRRRGVVRPGGRMAAAGLLSLLLLGACDRSPPRTGADAPSVPVHIDPATVDGPLKPVLADTRRRAEAGELSGWIDLALLYHANGYAEAAESAYRELIRRQPAEPRWPYSAAVVAAGYGRLTEAEPWFRRAVELAPTEPVVQLRLGELLLKTNRLEAAAASFADAARLSPDFPWAQVGLARVAAADGRWPEARRLLERVVAAHPDFFGANSLLATVYERLGETAAAEAPRRRARAAERYREPPDPWLDDLYLHGYDLYRLQVLASAAGVTPRSVAILRRALELWPDDPKTLRQLAQVYLRTGDKDAARQAIDRALAVAPTDPEGYLDLVPIYHAQGDRAGAEARLREGLRAAPDHAGLHYEAAMIATADERLDEAIAHLEKARELDPRQLAAYPKLATLHLRQDRPNEARAVLEAALAQDADHGPSALLFARYWIRHGDAERAAELLERIEPFAAELADYPAVQREFAAKFGRRP